MAKNRVLSAGEFLVTALKLEWPFEYAIDAADHYRVKPQGGTEYYQSDITRRAQIKVRAEIKIALESLAAANNIDSVVTAVNKYTARPQYLLLWKKGEQKTGAAVPYRSFRNVRSVSLGGGKFDVMIAGHPNRGARQFYYSLIRQTIEDGTVERFKLCKQCRDVFYQRSRKAECCGNKCRSDFNNHSESRARRRIKGVWIPDKKKGEKHGNQ